MIAIIKKITHAKEKVMNTRIEHDTMGEVAVPSEAYWGAQTERSRNNFKIGGETLPQPLIEAMALVKKAAAQNQGRAGLHQPGNP